MSPIVPEYVCQIWLRSDGRVEKGGYRQTDKGKLQLYIIEGNVLIYLEIAMNTVHCVGPNMVNMASTQLKFEFYQKHILANGESGSHDW